MLYPLKTHPMSFYTSRIYSSILLFPALVTSLYVLKLTAVDDAIIKKLTPIPLTNLVWGNHIDVSAAIICLTMVISFLVLIFYLPKSRHAEIISATSACFAIIIFILFFEDIVIKSALLSAAIVFAYVLNPGVKGFIYLRFCDILCYASLVLFLHQSIFTAAPIYSKLSIIGFITSLNLRILFTMHMEIFGHQSNWYRATNWILLYLGSLIMILPFNLLNLDFTAFILVLIPITIYTIIAIFYKKWILLTYLPVMICVFIGDKLESSLALSLAIPGIYVVLSSDEVLNKNRVKPTNHSKILLNFLTIFYSGFLLFRLPQILIAILKIPLRLFNDGNLQKSLAFIAMMLAAYLYLWWQ